MGASGARLRLSTDFADIVVPFGCAAAWSLYAVVVVGLAVPFWSFDASFPLETHPASLSVCALFLSLLPSPHTFALYRELPGVLSLGRAPIAVAGVVDLNARQNLFHCGGGFMSMPEWPYGYAIAVVEACALSSRRYMRKIAQWNYEVVAKMAAEGRRRTSAG
jgi:hypothetical protein